MPQWFRERAKDQAKYPDERWQADCPTALTALLLRYDHHVVRVNGRPALLRTYEWAADPANEAIESRSFEVSFTYAARHPGAPADVQALIDTLTFRPITISTERADER